MAKNPRSKPSQRKAHAPWIYFVGVIIFIFAISRLYFAATDDFRVSNISFRNQEDAYSFKIDTPEKKELESVKEALNQTYSYMGKGGQAYAFLSQDGKYILKLFKFKHLEPSWYISLLPDAPFVKEWKVSYLEKKKKRMDTVFNGYRIAYLKDKENSGLVYIHLAPTDYLRMDLSVKDKLGLKHKFSADKAVFVLQQKGETLRTHLSKQLKQGEVEKGKQTVASIFSLFVEEYQKGLIDLDKGVMHNTGFIGEKPFHLDVGKFTEDSDIKNPENFRKDLLLIFRKIDMWIEKNYPQYYGQMHEYLSELLEEKTGSPFTEEDKAFLKATPVKK